MCREPFGNFSYLPFFSLLFLVSCATFSSIKSSPPEQGKEEEGIVDRSVLEEVLEQGEAPPGEGVEEGTTFVEPETEEESGVEEGVPLTEEEYRTPPSFPGREEFDQLLQVDHPLVDRWVDFFTKTEKGREFFQKSLYRLQRYGPILEKILLEEGMPEKLVWLAFVESGVNPMAYSRARAVGIWQFILSTGKRYGLRRTPYVDERKDFILSTRSAIQYLKTLYLSYGSWELALAAYNAGEKKVDKAIRKTRHTDYWGHIQRRRILPRETKNYVPKLIAAYKVGQHLEEYGFSFDPAVEPVTFVVVPVTRPISLSDLAQSLSIPRTVLDELNPHLRKGVTPPGEVFPLRVPPSLKEVALNTIPNLPPVNLSQFAEYEQEMVHRVRKGETLWSIARKYGVSYRTLMEENDLRKTILRPGQKLYIPIRSSRSSRIYTQTTASSYRLYRVRRGDTLYRISRRWGVPIKDILSLNGEKRKEVLKEGEVIKIPISPSF